MTTQTLSRPRAADPLPMPHSIDTDAPAERRCLGCGEIKPPSEFGRQSRLPSGLNPRCLACTRRYSQLQTDRRRLRRHVAGLPARRPYRLGGTPLRAVTLVSAIMAEFKCAASAETGRYGEP